MPETTPYETCGAEDYPVWADGSQDRMVCDRPAHHEGTHLDSEEDWEWSLDMRHPSQR